ncbi:Histone acetyltransferase, partial [Corchorus olitorius]
RRQRARILRSADLRLFRHHHRQAVLPDGRCVEFADALCRHVWRVVHHAAARLDGARQLCRPRGPQGRADVVDPADDAGHGDDRVCADLCVDRSVVAGHRDRGATAAGLFGRR